MTEGRWITVECKACSWLGDERLTDARHCPQCGGDCVSLVQKMPTPMRRNSMTRSAEFSPCRRYRYALWRDWGDMLDTWQDGYVMFVGLNPSTADETHDDATIRRCIGFVRSWGYRRLCMTNLFAYRATKRPDMRAQEDPIGPQNDETLVRLAKDARIIVAAWGTDGAHRGRDAAVRQLLPRLHYLHLTKDGHPGHPLYLPATATPVGWVATNGASKKPRIVQP